MYKGCLIDVGSGGTEIKKVVAIKTLKSKPFSLNSTNAVRNVGTYLRSLLILLAIKAWYILADKKC